MIDSYPDLARVYSFKGRRRKRFENTEIFFLGAYLIRDSGSVDPRAPITLAQKDEPVVGYRTRFPESNHTPVDEVNRVLRPRVPKKESIAVMSGIK